jgi:hypothetical protein
MHNASAAGLENRTDRKNCSRPAGVATVACAANPTRFHSLDNALLKPGPNSAVALIRMSASLSKT